MQASLLIFLFLLILPALCAWKNKFGNSGESNQAIAARGPDSFSIDWQKTIQFPDNSSISGILIANASLVAYNSIYLALISTTNGTIQNILYVGNISNVVITSQMEPQLIFILSNGNLFLYSTRTGLLEQTHFHNISSMVMKDFEDVLFLQQAMVGIIKLDCKSFSSQLIFSLPETIFSTSFHLLYSQPSNQLVFKNQISFFITTFIIFENGTVYTRSVSDTRWNQNFQHPFKTNANLVICKRTDSVSVADGGYVTMLPLHYGSTLDFFSVQTGLVDDFLISNTGQLYSIIHDESSFIVSLFFSQQNTPPTWKYTLLPYNQTLTPRIVMDSFDTIYVTMDTYLFSVNRTTGQLLFSNRFSELVNPTIALSSTALFLSTFNQSHNTLYAVQNLTNYCFGVFKFDQRVCSGVGICVSQNECLCNTFYGGVQCELNFIPIFMLSIVAAIVVCIILVLSICFIFGCSIGLCCLCVSKQKRKKEVFVKLQDLEMPFLNDTSPLINAIDMSLITIPYEQIDMSDAKILGDGASALVIKAKYSKQIVAVKLLKTRTDSHSLHYFQQEISLFTNIRHPNIVMYYGSCYSDTKLGIVLECCEKGSMAEYISKNNQFSWKKKCQILEQICRVCAFLHSKGIIHRDLKCDNVLFDSELNPKLSDFGTAKKMATNNPQTQQIGTDYYIAPEVFKGEHYNEKCDVFSFAIIMMELLVWKIHPYKQSDDNIPLNIGYAVAQNPLFRPRLPATFKMKSKYETYLEMMQLSWSHNPSKRPSFDELSLFFENLTSQHL